MEWFPGCFLLWWHHIGKVRSWNIACEKKYLFPSNIFLAETSLSNIHKQAFLAMAETTLLCVLGCINCCVRLDLAYLHAFAVPSMQLQTKHCSSKLLWGYSKNVTLCQIKLQSVLITYFQRPSKQSGQQIAHRAKSLIQPDGAARYDGVLSCGSLFVSHKTGIFSS